MRSIFDDLAGERLFALDAPPDAPTGPLPAVSPTSLLPATPPRPAPRGEDDHLIRRTFNGLRPADLALPQPPQDHTWRPR